MPIAFIRCISAMISSITDVLHWYTVAVETRELTSVAWSYSGQTHTTTTTITTTAKKVKVRIAPDGLETHHRATELPTTWDHTVLPATWYSIHLPRRDGRLS